MPRTKEQRNPYTAEEVCQLKEWHAQARQTRATTPPDAEERRAGDQFADFIAERRFSVDPWYTWKELSEPLDIAGRTLNAFMARRGYAQLEPSRPAYQGVAINQRFRTDTHFPCGVHEITPENSYPPSRPGGVLRCAPCERESRKKRYERQKARRAEENANWLALLASAREVSGTD